MTNIAVNDGIAKNQIRNLYNQIRTKGIVDCRIYLKSQMGRSDRHQTIISEVFGDRLLSFLSKYQKRELITLLEYVGMLYEFTKKHRQKTYSQHSSEGSSNKLLTDNVRKTIEQVIKSNTLQLGFAGVNIEQMEEYGRVKMMVHVKVNRFYGDPKVLSLQLKNALKVEVKEIGNTFFNVWID